MSLIYRERDVTDI